MEYGAFKFRRIVFWDKSRMDRHHFSVVSDDGALYDCIIEDVGHNAVDIVLFFKYREIINSNASIERQLHEAISKRITNPRVLKDTADDRKYDLYGHKVSLEVDNHNYNFEINGIGPQAVKISTQITYDEITTSDGELESSLREIIENKYASKFKDTAFLKMVDAEWAEKEAHKNKIMDEVRKEEEIKRKKQEELERLLKS